MSLDNEKLLKNCQKILIDNRRGSYTLPAEGIYPHQWLWDSCFMSIGLAHFDKAAAKQELKSLARGQWANGMLPCIIFAKDLRYGLDRYFWDSKRNLDAPKKIATSGITQSPMLAEAVIKIGKQLSVAEKNDWYKSMFSVIVKYHQWLYQERDPDNTGLVFQIHPWEVGLDNTPPWISEIRNLHKPWWLPIIRVLPVDLAMSLLRRDTRITNKKQRISNIDALFYFDIILRLRKADYLIDEFVENNDWILQDLTYNCILMRANQHLRTIADAIGKKLPDDLSQSVKLTENALNKLWDEDDSEYYSRNYATKKLVKQTSIASLMPLYSQSISHPRAIKLVEKLHEQNQFAVPFPVPTVPVNSKWFSEHSYWQGPAWINTNWLIVQGLRNYGFNKEAKLIADKSLELVAEHGCWEYFSPLDGTPVGAKNFSWTAALAIDFLKS